MTKFDTNIETKPRMIGINHVALEVGDIEEALAFYGKIFNFELRGRGQTMAFIDMGDQFLALSAGRTQKPDTHRHFGLVVDDRTHVRNLATAAGATMLSDSKVNFLDPWGNCIEVVEYRDVQFTKSDAVLDFLSLRPDKSEDAQTELRAKGIEA